MERTLKNNVITVRIKETHAKQY